MQRQTFNALLMSDFNIGNLAGLLENDEQSPAVKAAVAPYGHVSSVIVNEDDECWSRPVDIAVVWTRPEGAIPSFAALRRNDPVTLSALIGQVDEYCSLIKRLEDRVSLVLVPTWVLPTSAHGLGMIDMREGGVAHALTHMNLRLCERIATSPKCYCLNTQKWIEAAGPAAFDARAWYMAKIPFGSGVFRAAVGDIKAAVQATFGAARKLLIVDADDTLWGGIVGDVGWKALRVGGHDAIGEAFLDVQNHLKALARRGVLLGLVSKNEEGPVLEAFRSHPEMVLSIDDFAAYRINWHDKAQNIVDLVSELNLGLDSVVFLDDHPVERARVRDALPDVHVPELPANALLYPDVLASLRSFDVPAITAEDRQRTLGLEAERQRSGLQKQLGSVSEWVGTLNMVVTIEELCSENLTRAAQLFNKTNQMNLSTRRLAAPELIDWAAVPTRRVWTFRVRDKFGDYGLMGILSVDIERATAHIVDFVLSCRVMGRQVEEAMLATAVEYGRSQGVSDIVARYMPTPRNAPCLRFWQRSGFSAAEDEHLFKWSCDLPYPPPSAIVLTGKTLERSSV